MPPAVFVLTHTDIPVTVPPHGKIMQSYASIAYAMRSSRQALFFRLLKVIGMCSCVCVCVCVPSYYRSAIQRHWINR